MAMQGGFGAVFKIYTTALTTVTHVLDAEFPELEKVLADMTGHDATGGWDEQVATGRFNSGEFKITLGFDDGEATHAAIRTAFNSLTAVQMSIENPDGSEVLTFNGHVAKMGRMSAQDDGYKCEVTIKPTGAVVIT